MEIEDILTELFDKSILLKDGDNHDGINDLLSGLSGCIVVIQDADFKQWVSEYTSYWLNPGNLSGNIEAFREETSELLIGYRDITSGDFEL